MNDRDLDAEFERIVAGWEAEAPDPQRSTSTPPPADAVGEGGSPSDATGSNASSDVAEPDVREPDGPGPSPEPTPPPGRSVPGGVKDSGLNLPIAPTTPHVWRGAEPPDEDVDELLESVDRDDEDHFTPPTEMDLPTAEEDPMFWAIVGGLGGGPLLLLYVLFFDRGGSAWWIVTAIAMIVVGFVLLVLRGGTERDPFDDGTRV